MNRKIKPITPRSVVKWLQRFPQSRRFKYTNGEKNDVCLFSKFCRYHFQLPHAVVGQAGKMFPRNRNFSVQEEHAGIVPFHDDFWALVMDNRNVSRNKAIKLLQTL